MKPFESIAEGCQRWYLRSLQRQAISHLGLFTRPQGPVYFNLCFIPTILVVGYMF